MYYADQSSCLPNLTSMIGSERGISTREIDSIEGRTTRLGLAPLETSISGSIPSETVGYFGREHHANGKFPARDRCQRDARDINGTNVPCVVGLKELGEEGRKDGRLGARVRLRCLIMIETRLTSSQSLA